MNSKRIKIITDSVADIPNDLLQKWNIDVIPCYVHYGGDSYLDDGQDLDRNAFFEYIKTHNEVPTTAAPSPGLAEEYVQRALEGHDHVISINISKTLSSTHNNVLLACNAVDAQRTTVLDSGSVSMGIGWMAIIAAEVAAETGDVDAVIQAVERLKQHHRLFAGIDNMEYLRRSGRVNAVTASIGTLLKIKPIVQVIADGEVISAHRVRTFKRVQRKLRDLLDEEAQALDRLAIVHVANEDLARQFIKDNQDVIPEHTVIADIGPTLGTHIGPDSLGFVSVNAAWRS